MFVLGADASIREPERRSHRDKGNNMKDWMLGLGLALGPSCCVGAMLFTFGCENMKTEPPAARVFVPETNKLLQIMPDKTNGVICYYVDHGSTGSLSCVREPWAPSLLQDGGPR